MGATSLLLRSICLVASDSFPIDSAIRGWLSHVCNEVFGTSAEQPRVFPHHEDALSFVRESGAPIIWVLIATQANNADVCHVLQDVARINADESCLRIRTLILLAGNHDPSTVVSYRRLGADVRSIQVLEEAERTIKDLHWLVSNPDKDIITLEFLYDDSQRLRIRLVGPLNTVDIPIDEVITKLMEHMAFNKGWHSKKALAEELGVNVETPTVYVDRFRDAYRSIQFETGEPRPAEHVLASAKLGVRWGYQLRAHIVKHRR